jgi:hypothetical protein
MVVAVLQWFSETIYLVRVMAPERPQPSQRLIFGIIMGGLTLWAIYLAIGAYRYNLNPWRGIIVLASMGIFLGGWLLLLWGQSRQKTR